MYYVVTYTIKHKIHNKEFILKSDNPILYSDADGVILDWLSGFIDYCASIKHIALHKEPTRFDMQDIFPKLEKPWELIHDYQASEFYHNMKSYQDAREALQRTKDMGVSNIIVTSCGDTSDIMNSRNATIEREFSGCVDNIIYLPYGSSKLEILKKLKPGVFIDDQEKIAIEGLKAGHDSFLKKQSYNINHTNKLLGSIDNMNEICLHF